MTMQPPPRKGNFFKVCKNLHSEQLSKLQAKNQQECDLLEDIRNFMKQRSAIEKSYGEALCKISVAYQNRKIACVPDIRLEDGSEAWNVYSVWRTVLDETEKLGKARLAAVEIFQQRISEDAKQVRQNKVNIGKKLIDNLGTIQKEVQIQVQDLDRTKRSYYEEENVAYDAREKASAAEEKLKRKKGSIFQSISSLQKNSAKFTAKKELCDEKSAGARNDYLLSLCSANAHQRRYYEIDFERILRTMECDMYDKVADYLKLLSKTELFTCSATQSSYTKIREQANTITRGYNLRCYLTFYPMLGKHIEYDYEPCKGDQITVVRIHDENSKEMLNAESKKCVATVLKQVKIIREATKKMHKLQSSHKDGEYPPEVDYKIEDIKSCIRKAETLKYKAEAKIETLKEGGIEVEDYSKSIDTDSLGAEIETPLSRSGSTASVKEEVEMDGEVAPTSVSDKQYSTDSADADRELESQFSQEQVSAPGTQKSLDPANWDPISVDWGDEPVSPLPPVTNGPTADEVVYPKCIVLYNYTAQNPDELTIVENEEIEMISEGDGDGWVQARNYKGEVGYIPQNYVEMDEGAAVSMPQYPEDGAAASETAANSGYQYDAAGEEELEAPISFSSIDYSFEGGEYVEGDVATTEAPADLPPPPPSIIKTENEKKPVIPTIDFPPGGDATSHSIYCIAMYDYEATCDEELTFEEGQIIRILKKAVHDVDDGWWEGEMDGKIGLFPSLVVDECRSDGEPLTPDVFTFQAESVSSPCTTPPPHTPPEVPGFLLPPEKVIITQPTPDVETAEEAIALREKQKQEEKEGTSAANGGVVRDETPNFELELSGDQQQNYQRQFSSSPDSETATDREHQYAELVSSPEVSNQEEDPKNGTHVSVIGGGVTRPTTAPPPPPTVVAPPKEDAEVEDTRNDKDGAKSDEEVSSSTYIVTEKTEEVGDASKPQLFLPGLDVAQIVVTCPTPMKEHAEEEQTGVTEDSRAEADQITEDDGQAESEDTEGEANFLEDDRPPPPPPAPEGGGGSGVEERREEYDGDYNAAPPSAAAEDSPPPPPPPPPASSSASAAESKSAMMKSIESENLEGASPTPKSPSPSDGPPDLDPEKLKTLERIKESIA